MKYQMIDLCCGIGGIRRGFELASEDFENVLSADIDAKARRTYQHLFGEENEPLGSISGDSFLDDLKCRLDQHGGQYDVLLAGFPCQAFSSVGKELGFLDETRGTVFFDIANVVAHGPCRPKAIFLENVQNLVRHNRGETFQRIIEVLEEELDYKVIGVQRWADGTEEDGEGLPSSPVGCYDGRTFIRNSRHFGLPQNRPRAYIIAFDRKRYGKHVWDLSNELPYSRLGDAVFPKLQDIVQPANDVDTKYYLSSGMWSTLKKHRTRQKSKGYGFGYAVLNENGEWSEVSHTLLATGGSGRERNMICQPKDGVAGTRIPGRQSDQNDEGIRYLTPTEWGRLQGFIDYAFDDVHSADDLFPAGTSDGIRYKQLGNSVAITVVEEMAKYVHESLIYLDTKVSII